MFAVSVRRSRLASYFRVLWPSTCSPPRNPGHCVTQLRYTASTPGTNNVYYSFPIWGSHGRIFNCVYRVNIVCFFASLMFTINIKFCISAFCRSTNLIYTTAVLLVIYSLHFYQQFLHYSITDAFYLISHLMWTLKKLEISIFCDIIPSTPLKVY
jgi:hypothetical protein